MDKRESSTSWQGIQHESPWAPEEHQRFLLALEQFGGGQCASIGQAWQQITTAVGTRDSAQVVVHARLYFAHLQHLHTQKRACEPRIDPNWSSAEDSAFENMLAAYSSSPVCYPWKALASRFPNKSDADLKDRYEQLCQDVARIERGPELSMLSPPLNVARSVSGSTMGNMTSQMTSPRVLDSVITVTPAEEQILIEAMADVFVPPQAPANLLAGIASAVAAFTSSNGRVPPQRSHSTFTKEEALAVLNRLLAAQQSDPQIVLETLAQQLRLHPRTLDISAGVSFSNNLTECPPSASTRLSLESVVPSSLAAEFGLAFEGSTPRLSSSSPGPDQGKQVKNAHSLTSCGVPNSNNG